MPSNRPDLEHPERPPTDAKPWLVEEHTVDGHTFKLQIWAGAGAKLVELLAEMR